MSHCSVLHRVNQSISSIAACDVILADKLHNKLAHILTLAFWHEWAYCWIYLHKHKLYRLPENLLWFPSIPLRFYRSPSVSQSSLFAHLPAVSWRGPSLFGTVPAARFPSLHLSPSLAPIFCIVETLLRKARRNSTQGFAVTHTHTRCAQNVACHEIDAGYIIFTLLFIHLYLSVYPLAFFLLLLSGYQPDE